MNQWKVTAYTGKNGEKALRHTWVRASSQREAIEIGRQVLRMIGVRGRFNVSAVPYSPIFDRAFLGYVVPVG